MTNNTKVGNEIMKSPDAPFSVLVVDDDPALRLYARNVMQRRGINVAEAGSGNETMELISRHAFDCVLLDISMPGMDGFDTCREIRARPGKDRLPIVVITGLDDMLSIERAYDSGATDFVTKPVNWPILEQRIRHLSRGYRMARRLNQSELDRKALQDAIPDTIVRMDAAGVLTELKAAHLPTLLDQRLRQRGSLPAALPRKAAENTRIHLRNLRETGSPQCFEFELGRGAKRRHYEARMIAADDGECIVTIRDFTERRLSDDRIHQLAFYDQLTQLPNAAMIRKQLTQYVENAIEYGFGVAVLRIAIQELEHIDSVLGHRAKSALVRQVAARLCGSTVSKALPKDGGNTFVGRLEGSEFVLLLSPMNQRSEIGRLTEVIKFSLDTPFNVNGNDVSVTAKIGVATFPGDGTEFQLLDKAGSALDEAKRQQGTCCRFYSSDLHRRRLERMALEMRIRRALDNDEFFLEYQPKVTADTRRLVGVEALVRWRNAELGVVQPNCFIPLAEQTGLIVPLGERVLDLACQQAKQWVSAGCARIPIAVNFSGRQFGQWDVIAGIRRTIDAHGIDAEQLEVEVTETSVMHIREQITGVLTRLRAMGIRLAIDDFGTGYSSLGLLRGLPFDILKIDRGFIRHVLTDQGTASITEAIIRMGQALGIEIVAEGVEDELQMEFLRNKGCDIIQGYLTGRPASADVIGQQLMHKQPNPVIGPLQASS